MTDKQQEYLLDAVEEGVSNCCSAPVIGDVCSDRKEHCNIVLDEELDEEIVTGRHPFGN